MRRVLTWVLPCVAVFGCTGLEFKPDAEVHPAYRQTPPRVVAIPPATNRSDELDPATSVVIWEKLRLPGQRRDAESRENPVLATFRWCMGRQLHAHGMRVVRIDADDAAWKGLSTRDRYDARAIGKAYGADAVCRLTVLAWESRSLSGSGRVRFHAEYALTRCEDGLTLWRCSRGSQVVRPSPGVEGSGLSTAIRRDVDVAFKTLP